MKSLPHYTNINFQNIALRIFCLMELDAYHGKALNSAIFHVFTFRRFIKEHEEFVYQVYLDKTVQTLNC
jgi:hypothetical protein